MIQSPARSPIRMLRRTFSRRHTMTGAELEHMKSDLLAAQLDVARYRAALSEDGDPIQAFKPPEVSPAQRVEMHRHFLVSQIAEQRSKVAEIDRQHAQKEAERD